MSPERRGGEPGKENKPQPYCRAVRFQTQGPARRGYLAAQDMIYKAECDLSAYRFLLNGIWHVAVLGDPPPEELDKRLTGALRAGDSVSLPEDLVTVLVERGKEQRRLAPWVERHYGPQEKP